MTIEERAKAAAGATYLGSPEHKAPHTRNDATRCPTDLEAAQERLTGWLKEAIQAGYIGGPIEGEFPRYVWCRDGCRYFEGRLTNQMSGEYKGYPVSSDEVPSELKDRNA
jgi:hypothetical protein